MHFCRVLGRGISGNVPGFHKDSRVKDLGV